MLGKLSMPWKMKAQVRARSSFFLQTESLNLKKKHIFLAGRLLSFFYRVSGDSQGFFRYLRKNCFNLKSVRCFSVMVQVIEFLEVLLLKKKM